MRVAFYAPMKPHDHPVPSGDRQMARNLMRALTVAGFEVEVASRLRTYSSEPGIAALMAAAAVERERLRAQWATAPPPGLWFTYHPYYRAPDLLGPALSRELRIPYVTAEASYAGKRDRDEWRDMQAPVVSALQAADLNLCLTHIDRRGLEGLVGPRRLSDLPPFIDPAPFSPAPKLAGGVVRLVTVAMMRRDAKLDSYRILARALSLIPTLPWSLTVIGDGPARPEVEAAFANLEASRISWLGGLPAQAVPASLAEADLFVWPGIGEAYGVAYLEAQAAGLPVVAMKTHGVSTVVRTGETGLLTPALDIAAYANGIAMLIGDGSRRLMLGAAARAFVTNERSITAAGQVLSDKLRHLTTSSRASTA